MALVENNVVKMDWEKTGWLQTKKGIFVIASKVFDSTLGFPITVFFRPDTAFVWCEDDEDGDVDEDSFVNAKDLKSWLKDGNFDEAFPDSYDEYLPIIDSGFSKCNPNVLAKLGLDEFAEEIAKRMADVAPYDEESEVQM